MTKRCHHFSDFMFLQTKYHINDKLTPKKITNNIFVSLKPHNYHEEEKLKKTEENQLKNPNLQQFRTKVLYRQLQLDHNGQLYSIPNVCNKQLDLPTSCTSCRIALNINHSSICNFCEKFICENCSQKCIRCSGIFCQLCSMISYEQHFDSAICLSCFS